MDLAKIQLNRAELLANGLNVEAERWSIKKKELGASLINLIGNILISAAYIAYLGPFTSNYRKNLIQEWVKMFCSKGIPTHTDFSLKKYHWIIYSVLTDDAQVQAWSQNNLPIDQLSIENAICILNTKKYPLIIDPQN